MKITPDLFAAYLKCPTKCWLRSRGEAGGGNEYADWVRSQNESFRHANAARLLESLPDNERAVAPPATENLKTVKWRLAVNVPVETAILESCLHAVERLPAEGRGKPAQFIPIRFVFTNKLTKDDRLLVAFDALVLSEVLGREVSLGKIIHGDDHATLKVKTSALFKEARKRIEKIAALLESQSPPDLVLNRHCNECEFPKQCRQKAVEKDDLSLLAGMKEKERKKFNNKGIFTITQLSYTFRPRRRPKRLRDKREKYHHSLKALAIREKKIHIVGSPELQIEGTPVYLDVEGLPDRDFYYLIGLRIGNGESAVQHSLWADTVADEGKIWREFLGILETIEKPVLIHYGSYETHFLGRMSERYGKSDSGSAAAGAIESAVNVLSILFAQVYFPIHSNGLKDIAGWIGFKWSNLAPSGANSVAWRHDWETSRVSFAKQTLVTYNTEDCMAVEILVQLLVKLDERSLDAHAETDLAVPVKVDSLSAHQTMWPKFKSSVVELEEINKAARWNYQRDRVYVRSSKIIRKIARADNRHTPCALKVTKVVECPKPDDCPRCHDNNFKHVMATWRVVRDLHIGRYCIRRRVVEYRYHLYKCPTCQRQFGVPHECWPRSKYGRSLVSYLMYQVVELCVQMNTVAHYTNRLFDLGLTEAIIHNLKVSASRNYKETRENILSRLIKGTILHVDETRVNVKGKTGYVWVITNLHEVVYLYADTREGEFIQETLREFRGVLISDFYSAYDSFQCPQQKCLLHLIRDLNQEMLNEPYDDNLKTITTEFGVFLRAIVATIDRFGLKRHFLHKHHIQIDRFFRYLAKMEIVSEAAARCRQRLEKNRDTLFTFIDHDGVPWNNNNAEHAIKAFAKLRDVVWAAWTPKAVEQYLVLLSICQTCKYQGLDFLDFLCSGEKDIATFAESRRRKRKRPVLDTSAATTTSLTSAPPT